MLPDIFHATTVNTKQKQETHGMWLAINQCENLERSKFVVAWSSPM
jgi:hypothetical protein